VYSQISFNTGAKLAATFTSAHWCFASNRAQATTKLVFSKPDDPTCKWTVRNDFGEIIFAQSKDFSVAAEGDEN